MIEYEDILRFKNKIDIAKKVRIILFALFVVSIPFYLYNTSPATFLQMKDLSPEAQMNLTGNFFLFQTISSVLLAVALLFVPVPMIMNRIMDRKYLERIKAEYFPAPETTIGLEELKKILSIQESDLHRLGLDKPDGTFTYLDFAKGFAGVKRMDTRYDKTRKFRIGVKF